MEVFRDFEKTKISMNIFDKIIFELEYILARKQKEKNVIFLF